MLAQSFAGGWGRVISLLVAIQALSLTARAQYGGGNGTPENPYLILTAAQLNAIGAQPGDWGRCFKLMADIDLSGYPGTEFNRIGTPDDGPFAGTFDGNYKTISSFRWSSEWMRYIGLFGFVDGENALIMNVTLVAPVITNEGGQYTAALAGFLRAGTIANCHVRRGEISGDACVGALVGKRESGTIMNCTVSAAVSGGSRVGGLIGHSYWGLTERCDAVGDVTGCLELECWAAGGLIGENQNGIVADCHASCSVEGRRDVGGLIGRSYCAGVRRCWTDGAASGEQDIGGLIGRNDGGEITDCYSLTDASGVVFIGGLAGFHGPSCDCTTATIGVIERCYAAGPVSGLSDRAGLAPANPRGLIRDSFWDIQTTGCRSSADGNERTTEQMQDPSTYLSAGWDFAGEKQNGIEDVWHPPAPGSYPRLAWQRLTGDLDGDGKVDSRDFAVLARQWRRIDNAFWSHGTFMAADGTIDFDDLDVFADAWLTSGE
ncbi:MAG: hypothetical protein JW955_23900 [Sedimentisphaerales bacterium]|nr:hypothetical protein [Sedimentisphaerales bacterium]